MAKGNQAVSVGEECGEVDVPAVLNGRVVVGGGVVVAVEALARLQQKQGEQLGRSVTADCCCLAQLFPITYLRPWEILMLVSEWRDTVFSTLK